MKEIRKKVIEYQKQNQTDQIQQFSVMELKRIQVDLNSGEVLNDEACGIITSAKKESRRIWDSVSTLIKEAGLPQLEMMETILPENSWVATMEATQQAKRENIRQIKELRWEDVKSTLVDETRLQAQIESWRTRTEISLQKKVMKGVCQYNYALENYKSENLLPLTDAHDQWEAFLDQIDHTQPKAGGSSTTPEIIHLDITD